MSSSRVTFNSVEIKSLSFNIVHIRIDWNYTIPVVGTIESKKSNFTVSFFVFLQSTKPFPDPKGKQS